MAGAWTPSHWLHWNGPWSRASTLAPGTLVSRHLRLVRPVVDLGVQNTWVAEHLALKREVSVTFHVPGSSAASLTASADAEHLLRQSSALSHVRLAEPHFVHVIEQGTANGVTFIVTELLEGMSLRHRLAHGHPLSLDEAEHVVTQVAGALATAHAAGVAHGNLCPEMLFLSEVLGKPFVKVLGFGATFDSGDARASESAAIQAYTSPEQLLGATGRDAQGDLWALAVSLYELLTTILPFEAPTPAGVTVAICNAQFSAPSHYRADLPPAIDAWFARALSTSVTNRFRDAGALARAFALATGRGGVPDQAAMLAPSTRVGAEQDEDEMTVRWDVPGEWPATNPPRAGSVSGPIAAAALPSGPLPGAPPPLPNRIASSRPPPSLDSTAATGFSLSPPTSAALPRDSYLAAVASALAVPASSPAAALPPSSPVMRAAAPAVSAAAVSPVAVLPAGISLAANAPSSRALDRRLILAASLLSVLAVASAWLYSSNGSSSSGSSQATRGAPALQAASDSTPIVAVTVRAEDLPEVGSDDDPAIANERELPQIIQTHDLPPAPEEGAEEVPSDVELAASDSPTARAGVPPVARHVAAPSVTRAAGTTPRSTRSQTAGQATCNPPYYFDANNIRRLKLECLGGPVQKKHALTPAAPARNKPIAGNQARAGASCTPPYYFDRNNIRRLKLECL